MADTRKIGLITGAGTGVGHAVALALMQKGYALVLAGRRPGPLQETAEQAKSMGATAFAVPTDVSDPASVKALFQEVEARFGRLDLLFNNAGTNVPASPLEEITYENWRAVIDINLTGAFLCTQEAFRLMHRQKPGGGRIINNGSISAQVPRFNATAYNASKHGMTGLTRSTALEGRKWNIACGQIDIGNAATPMAAAMTTGVLQADGSLKTEPTISPDSVVGAVVYMASLPLEANVLFLTVMATNMPFVGRG